MERYYILADGYVQGVGFRYFVYYTAKAMDLTGWVRNLDDGSVEMEVQGSKANIELFIDKIKEGNGFAEVNSISATRVDKLENEHSFRVTY